MYQNTHNYKSSIRSSLQLNMTKNTLRVYSLICLLTSEPDQNFILYTIYIYKVLVHAYMYTYQDLFVYALVSVKANRYHFDITVVSNINLAFN